MTSVNLENPLKYLMIQENLQSEYLRSIIYVNKFSYLIYFSLPWKILYKK